MYKISEVKEFLSSINSYKILFHKDVREKFFELYYYTFEEVLECEGCAGNIDSAMIKFNSVIKKQSTFKILSKAKYFMKYAMKPNTRVYSFKMNTYVTPHNCTDEIAEALMQENPKYKDLFLVNPEFAKVVQTNPTFSVQPLQESESITEEKSTFSAVVKEQTQKKKRGRKPKK
jgi:hypothetical protein